MGKALVLTPEASVPAWVLSTQNNAPVLAHQTQGSWVYSFGSCVNQLLLPLTGETELENLPLSSSSFRGGIWAGTPETLAQTRFHSTELIRES